MTERKAWERNEGQYDPPREDPLSAIADAAANPQDAPDMSAGTAPDGPGSAYDRADLGPECPITPLGFRKQKFYFLDFAGQLIELGSEFRKGELMALFGTRMGFLDEQWPQWKKVGERDAGDGTKKGIFEKDGFSQKDAQQGLIMACSKLRPFDPDGKVRGRGAHRGEDGELVLHCGDRVIVGGRKGVKGRSLAPTEYKSGRVGSYVYPTLTAIKPPNDEPASIDTCKLILAQLESWRWTRGPLAAYLLFCWIAAACLGGALKNRPHAWIVGPSGAGKTTLQDYLREIIAEWGVFTEDATEAGVRQKIDQDTLAVMFDEIEAEADNQEVVNKIVRLARLAYSGASAMRGSSDHQAKQFVARSCFLFSSIHHHEMPAQDRNRIAILQLSEFPPETPKFLIPTEAKEWGDKLRRRLIEQWPRYEATLATYQAEMLRQGYSGREQDTYGTLLACGDLLLHDMGPDAIKRTGAAYDQVRELAGLIDAARAEAEGTAERCRKHLSSHRLPAKPGEAQQTIARWVQRQLVALYCGQDPQSFRERLGSHGLRVVHLEKGHESGQGGLVDAYVVGAEPPVPMWLAVANKTNKGVQEIFAGSSWPGGVWTQALALTEGSWRNKKSRFGGGSPEGCVLVPLDSLVDVAGAIEEAMRLKADDPR
jgi:hypothetical protein